MSIYLCRWQNGDFSIVQARNHEDAVDQLDEWGNAEEGVLTRLSDCMLDFTLEDDGRISLRDIGERTLPTIMERCYPFLDKKMGEIDERPGPKPTDEDFKEKYAAAQQAQKQEILAAVQHERERLWGKTDSPVSEDPTERMVQEQTNMPLGTIRRIRAADAERKAKARTDKRLRHEFKGANKGVEQ